MHHHLLTVAAIGMAFFSPLSCAQDSNVVLYGKLNLDMETVSAAGGTGTDAHTGRISNNSSLLGLRGEEALGGGLSAFFQIESAVGVDTGSGTLAGRNSGVGLRSAAGTILMGQWDTPYKDATLKLDPFTNKTFAGYGAVLYGNKSVTVANAVTRQSFDRRQKNLLQYWTPDAGHGVRARLAYGAREEQGSCAVACDPGMWSAAASYEQGPLSLMAAYERHDQYANTASVQTRDSAVKLGALYRHGGTSFSAIAERLAYRGNLAATGLNRTFVPGSASEASLRNYWMAVSHRYGAQTWRAAYGQSGDVRLDSGGKGARTAETGMRYWAVGYGYAASKRTELYWMYARIDNKAQANSDFAINGVTGVSNGAHPAGFGIGMTHAF